MKSTRKRKIVISGLVIMEIISLFLMTKSYQNKINLANELETEEKDTSNNTLAFMLEQSDGSYLESTTSTFPTSGYTYNSSKSGCIDNDGNEVSNAISFEDNSVVINTDSSVKCYLYFDLDD